MIRTLTECLAKDRLTSTEVLCYLLGCEVVTEVSQDGAITFYLGSQSSGGGWRITGSCPTRGRLERVAEATVKEWFKAVAGLIERN